MAENQYLADRIAGKIDEWGNAINQEQENGENLAEEINSNSLNVTSVPEGYEGPVVVFSQENDSPDYVRTGYNHNPSDLIEESEPPVELIVDNCEQTEKSVIEESDALVSEITETSPAPVEAITETEIAEPTIPASEDKPKKPWYKR